MKKFISLLLAIIVVFSFSSVAFAAQTQEEVDLIATRESLDAIVSSEISVFYDNIEDALAESIRTSLDSILNDPELIKKYIVPAVTEKIISNLAAIGIESEELNASITELLNSFAANENVIEVYNYFMSIEFVQAVKARTIDYAVEDALAQIGVGADKAAMIQTISDKIWNAPLVTVADGQPALKSDLRASTLKASLLLGQNTSYYAADITISGRLWNKKISSVTVTGWNEPVIKAYCKTVAISNGINNADEYVETAKNLDYAKIITGALGRAIKDEITIRFNAFIEKIATEAQEEFAEMISELSAEAREEFVEAIYEWTGKELEISPDATVEEIIEILRVNFCPAAQAPEAA